MNNRRLILILTLLLGMIFPSFGQIGEAKKEMALYNYSKAIMLLQKVLDKKEDIANYEAMLLIAECFRKQNLIPEAKSWYAKALAVSPAEPTAWYYYAQSLRTCGDYQMAKHYFLKYDSLVPSDRYGRLYAGYCDSAETWQLKKPLFEVKNAGAVNSPQSDFGPVYYNNGILFASDRITITNEQKLYGWTGYEYLRIFTSNPVSLDNFYGEFSPATQGPVVFNGEYHDGPVSFNGKQDEVFITRTLLNRDKGKKDPGRIRTHLLKLYSSVKKDGTWSQPEPFFQNSNDYSVGHPSLSITGDTLVFVSDKEGGFGGTDIYFSVRKDGKWNDPVNFGKEINTPGNEMFPFLSTSGDLYFSSDGLPGFGGLDLFRSRQINHHWTLPDNLGQPVNSSFDDFSIIMNEKEKTGLFSSNRPGGMGNDDIYCLRQLPPPPPLPAFVSGCVKDKKTLQPIFLSTVFMLDRASAKVLVIKTNEKGCFKTPVNRGKNYVFKGTKNSYIPDGLGYTPPPEPNTPSPTPPQEGRGVEFTIPRDLLLDRIEINKVFHLDNIFYDFDKWNIRPDAEPPLNKLVAFMKENPVKVELGSHTDCRGSDQYNEVLSQRRAESAVKYIISKGIDAVRITAKGYGESKLINRCNCASGIQCTEAEHQENRRTEFRITGWVEEKPAKGFDPDQFKEGELIDAGVLPEGFFDLK